MDMQLLTNKAVSLKHKKKTRKVSEINQQKTITLPFQSINNKYLSQNIFKINTSKRSEDLLTGFIIW